MRPAAGDMLSSDLFSSKAAVNLQQRLACHDAVKRDTLLSPCSKGVKMAQLQLALLSWLESHRHAAAAAEAEWCAGR